MKVKFFGCDAEAAPDNTSYCIQNFFCVFFSWTKQKQEQDEKEKSEIEERERGREKIGEGEIKRGRVWERKIERQIIIWRMRNKERRPRHKIIISKKVGEEKEI